MFTQTGESRLGFTVTRIRSSEELGGRLVELTYDRTGTKLCWVDNGMENKLFSVAFKTLPEDSTGVFHILEHSVLCGSEKYPVREPFVELLKSSMNTFLNAMTFPDKTMYPVSSRNARDFLNLAGVYLDAVFAPRILTNPNIFYQEGWHIEQAEDGTLSYKGVVFNEMKGEMSSADSISEQRMLELLFPDTCYGFNAGGEPKVIPSLTYEQFCETYRRFYHPSNALIFLDGDIPVDETLTLIAGYLSRFGRLENLPQIAQQQPKAARSTGCYELSADEPLENRGYLSVGKIAGRWDEPVKVLAIIILNDVVAGTNDAPIRRAVLSSGLAQEMSASVEDSVAQPYFKMDFRNIRDGSADELLALVRKTAAELADKGLDHAALEASANRLEFRIQEREEPQALGRCTDAMIPWLHGGDPMMLLESRAHFAALREMIRTGQIEELLRTLYADETDAAVFELLPSHSFGEEQRKDEADRLAAIAEKWSDADRAENRALNEKLLAWQQTPDTPEQLATLPVLTLDEVNPKAPHIFTEEQQTEGVTVLYHKQPCRDIRHFALYFRMTDLDVETLRYAALAAGFFGKLSTAHYSALALQQKMKNTVGRMDFSITVTAKEKETETCAPMLCVRCSVLKDKQAEAEELIREVLLHTNFRQKEKIREMLLQLDERNKQSAIMAGHAIGVSVTQARYSALYALTEIISGYSSIKWLHELTEHLDEHFDRLAAAMESVSANTVCRSRMLASMTASEPAGLDALIRSLPEGTPAPERQRYSSDLPDKSAYIIPAAIGFAEQSWQMTEGGFRFSGAMRVAAKLLWLSYLWNVVRVQGGAYGTGLSVTRSGTVYTFSYRDPNPAGALAANRGFSEYLRAFCESDEPLDKFIISTVSDEEPLRSPRSEGIFADVMWFSGYTEDDLNRTRSEILGCTREALLAQCEMWDAFAEKGAVCVVASEPLVSAVPDLTVLE